LTTSPVIAVNDIGSAADFLAAIEGTIRNFNDGDLVEGTVVQVDREEVLVDIGYKTEGFLRSAHNTNAHGEISKVRKSATKLLSEQLLKLLRVVSSLTSVFVASFQHLSLKCAASAT